MGRTKKNSTSTTRKPPAKSEESRENQLIAKAVDLAERQIEEGTASSQVICHYLKLGTTKARLEKEKLENENNLLKAKVENLKSQKEVEELYKNALAAMKSYSGLGSQDVDEEDD